MTTPLEDRRLAAIAVSNSVDDLRRTMVNAREKSPLVYRAAFSRLIVVSAAEHDDPVSRACWEMVHTIEQIRRESGRKVSRMHRLRPKIAKDGARAALEYCATHRTDGFQEVIDYGLAEYTAEAIVLRHPESFPSEATRTAARSHLVEAGIDPDLFDTSKAG